MAASIVTVYRNGDKNYPGKKLVLNRRHIRNFDAFLDKVTRDVKMKTATRSICTPTGGHRIRELDKIQTGGAYVAVGPETFKKLGYKNIREPKATPRKLEEITPVTHSKLVMSGRARKVADAEPTFHKTFFVFRNGDDLYPSKKLFLSKRDMSSMDKVLAFVTEKVRLQTGAVYCLCTMQGRLIRDPSELENNSQYVAVGHGKKFKKVAYSDHGASHIVTPRRATTKPRIVPHKKTSPNRTKAKTTPHKKRTSTSEKQHKPWATEEHEEEGGFFHELKEDIQETVQDLKQGDSAAEPSEEQHKPLATEEHEEEGGFFHELKEDIQEAVQDLKQDDSAAEPSEEQHKPLATEEHEEEGGFFHELKEDIQEAIHDLKEDDSAAEPSEEPTAKKTVVKPKEDSQADSTVYKASGEQKEDAIEIKEDKDTVEDKPIDQQQAEEVTEEQLEGDSSVEQSGTNESQ